MSSYRYKAVDEEGATVSGVLVAGSAEEARAKVREMRLFPQEVAPARDAGRRAFSWLPSGVGRAAGHLSLFTRHGSVLLASGVPLTEALAVLAEQCEHRGLRRALTEIHESANAGRSLAEALGDHPRFFDRSYVGVVAAGEKSGHMAEILSRLADFLERRRLVQSKLTTALIYPALLVVMVVVVLAFISGYVVPMIAPLLKQRGTPLPLSTELLFTIGDFVRYRGWTLPAAAIVAALLIAWLRTTSFGRRRLDALILRAPLVGGLMLKGVLSRFASTLAMLLRTGVPAVEALQIVRTLLKNAAFDAEIEAVREAVITGREISSRMRSSSLFPPMVSYVVSVGERSGNLAEVLERVAGAYDLEVDIASRRLLAVLEPALILVMAVVVGFVAASLMVTILELSHI